MSWTFNKVRITIKFFVLTLIYNFILILNLQVLDNTKVAPSIDVMHILTCIQFIDQPWCVLTVNVLSVIETVPIIWPSYLKITRLK